jgi:GntR family transcriptional repressor for pyruvate dehydrogenase complex
LTEQVQGFYDPEERMLFIASWLPISAQESVMMHEITHALQDQHFDLQARFRENRNSDNDDYLLAQQALFEGRIHPGDFLGTEASFAEDFGVSRIAVRDAMRALQANGIVLIRKGAAGGVHVAHGDMRRMSDALAIQIGLTEISSAHIIDAHYAVIIMSAELAAHHATEEDIALLSDLLDRALTSDPDRWGDTVHGINLALAHASKNPALAAQMDGFMEILHPYYQRLGHSIPIDLVVQRYRAMLAAVRCRDALTALTTMYEHLRRIRVRLAAAAQAVPDEELDIA